MLVIRIIISILTFPGVITHEIGHKLFCDLTGVAVFKVRYFRFGNPAGYVIHAEPYNFKKSFFITAGPFIVNTILAILLFAVANIFLAQPFYQVLFIWLGGSAAINAFPSTGDAKTLWLETNKNIFSDVFAIIGYPLVLIIWLANFLKIAGFDLIYAVILYEVALAVKFALGIS